MPKDHLHLTQSGGMETEGTEDGNIFWGSSNDPSYRAFMDAPDPFIVMYEWKRAKAPAARLF